MGYPNQRNQLDFAKSTSLAKLTYKKIILNNYAKCFRDIITNIFFDSCYKFSVKNIFCLFRKPFTPFDFAKSVLRKYREISIAREINLSLVYIFDDIAKTTSMKIFKTELKFTIQQNSKQKIVKTLENVLITY